MPVTAALLCDAATVREGLLHVLGAGITRLWRAELPAPMNVALALMIELEHETVTLPHEVHVRIHDPQGTVIGEAMGGFQIGDRGRLEAGENQLVPQVIPLHGVGVGQFGSHRIDISVDSEPGTPLRFWVLHPEEQLIPPIT